MTFRTIDLSAHLATCVAFRRDSFMVSFGALDGFEADMAGYEARMAARIAALPQGNCHLWEGDEIVGQTEMKLLAERRLGYVNLFYLAPGHRGRGLGARLHERARRSSPRWARARFS